MNAMKQILGCIRKADQDYGMIADHDRIAVGVSGGKDSMLLLYCLHLYQQFCQRIQSKQFEVVGIHIQMGFPSMDFTDAAVFFKQHGIRLELVPSRIYDILKIQANDDGSLKCSLCSTLKKGAVNRAAKDFGCTKVAFAHHGDDAIETLLMNAIYGGRLATFAPKMCLSNAEMPFIRPFIYARENQIRAAVESCHVPVVKSTCPMDGYTRRQDMKEMLERLYAEYPMARDNFLLMLHNEKQLSLWHEETADEQAELHPISKSES